MRASCLSKGEEFVELKKNNNLTRIVVIQLFGHSLIVGWNFFSSSNDKVTKMIDES